MAGRPSKPVQLIKSEGKSHRTKKELEHRKRMEESLYTGTNFRENPETKEDPIAHKEFLRLRRLYKKIEFIDGLDQQIINRYCLMLGQEYKLQEMISDIREDLAECEDVETRSELYKTMATMINRINQTRDRLLRLEDRLFLNPTARVKAIPKTPPEEENNNPMADFLKRRGNSG